MAIIKIETHPKRGNTKGRRGRGRKKNKTKGNALADYFAKQATLSWGEWIRRKRNKERKKRKMKQRMK